MLKIFLLIFGAVVIAGGLHGYLGPAKSVASIIAAGILGACIIVGALMLSEKPTVGLILALVGAVGVAGKFVPAYLKSDDKAAALWPAGVMAVFGVVALAWVIKTLAGK